MWGFNVMNIKFLAHSRFSEQQAMLMNMWLSFLFPRREVGWRWSALLGAFVITAGLCLIPINARNFKTIFTWKYTARKASHFPIYSLFPVDILATGLTQVRSYRAYCFTLYSCRTTPGVHSLTCRTATSTLSCGEERYSIFCKASNTEPNKEHGQLMLKRLELLLPFREGF